MFGAFLFAHPITGDIMASELCWWVDPVARGSRVSTDLVKRAETWARENGAKWLEMIAPNDRVGWFYARQGYERTDIHFLKAL
jgi:GNAT superfamily N-acetyltransferase